MEKKIKIQTQQELQALCGPHDSILKVIEKECKVKLSIQQEHLRLGGSSSAVNKAAKLVEHILELIRTNQVEFTLADIRCLIKNFQQSKAALPRFGGLTVTHHGAGSRMIGARTSGQNEYVEAIKKYDIVFGIGPAGTGKTYLAVACAVEALQKQQVRRLILTRPAIEAGESLGFLPGDMYEKISPYLRPLYDALYDMMEAETIEKYLETGIIEVAPLAYMRGRTLNDAFIILDEAQNCTPEQMKMFLTRIGFDSKAVITGDLTQSDLPNGKPSGLLQAQDILRRIAGIKFMRLTGADVVRHALVQEIIEAYAKASYDK